MTMRLRLMLCVLAGAVGLVPRLSVAGGPPAPATKAEAPAPAAKEVRYFAVMMAGKKAGHRVLRREVRDGKVTTTDEATIGFTRLGTPMRVDIYEQHVETADGRPLGFKTRTKPSLLGNIEATVDAQGKLHAAIATPRGVQRRVLDWPKGAVLSEGAHLAARRKGLKKGTKYTQKRFDCSVMTVSQEEVTIGAKRKIDLLGRVVLLTEVKTVSKNPLTGTISSTSYVDDEGHVLKETVPMMGMTLELVACTQEFALSKNVPVDLMARVALLKSPMRLKRPAAHKAITYVIAPTKAKDGEGPTAEEGAAKLEFPTTDSQTVTRRDGKVVVTVRPPAVPAGAQMPYKGSDETALAALKPTRFVESDDKRVVALARQAVGEANDPAAAIKRIEAFVHKYVGKKNLSVGYASAAEVAQSREGDCTEHAVLAAAMCRAVGIPAQVVVGVAYVDLGGRKGAVFGGHAWCQAYVAGKWVGLDAAMSRGCGAARITLAVGSGEPTDFFSMIHTLGYFRIESMSVEGGAAPAAQPAAKAATPD
jgi:hypothetical protein